MRTSTSNHLRALRIALASGLAALSALAASAPALADGSDTSSCGSAALSQPFLDWGDSNYYTLAPGQADDHFDGGGWTLNDGARISWARLHSGAVGPVLSLPAGSSAVSPPMCIDSDYPTARMLVRGIRARGSIEFKVSFTGRDGNFTDADSIDVATQRWSLSDPFQMGSDGLSGWVFGEFEFVAPRDGGVYQLYDFYVDPYNKG
jgi:hypothetical protein